jgi:flagellar protein FlbD
MIQVTRLGGKPFYLNSDLIESVESMPDTTIILTSGKRVLVQESSDEVVRRIVAFRRQIMAALVAPGATAVPDEGPSAAGGSVASTASLGQGPEPPGA